MREETTLRRTRAALLALGALVASGPLGCGLMPPEDAAQPAQPEKPADPAHGTLPPAGYALALDEPFDGSTLDATRWTAMDGPRRDARATPAAVTVSGGVLTLTTSTENGVHETGFVTTEGKFLQRRGYFEARIRFHDAPGSWCAFWLLSPTIGVPRGDPGKAGSEIDVVEHRVTDPSGWDALADMVQVAVNWDGYGANRRNVNHVGALPDGAKVQGEWHTYGVLWTTESYTFYVDGVAFWSTSTALSNVAQDVRLTCEVEDASWAGQVPAGGYGPRGVSTTRMDVDWVRVWRPPE
jgi:beta-glucanase (GH16 family)